MKTYTFHVNGMHCTSCVALIEGELLEMPEVSHAHASLAHFSVEVAGDFGDKTAEHVAADINELLRQHGYALSPGRQAHTVAWSDIIRAIPFAAGIIALFVILQKLGIVNAVSATEMNYGTAFVIGLVASVSTCMAVVGGLVLSMATNFAKEGETTKPQTLFHVGRLLSFFIFGGVIGAAGSVFQLGAMGTFVLGVLVGLVMLVLGINLLDIFPWAKRLQPTLPSFVGKHVRGLKDMNHTLTPFTVGVATFFLPCGFTQSMQIYTLTTGSFMDGALLMFVFSLGTLPALALISFSSLGIRTKAQSGVFFKTAGLVVVFFACLTIINSFAALGIIVPVFGF